VAGTQDGLRAADVARWTEESRRAGVVAADDWQRLADRRRYLVARIADLQAGSDDAEAPVSAGAAESRRRSLEAVDGLMRFVEALRAVARALPEHAPWPEMVASLTSLATARCAVAADDAALSALAELSRCGLVEDSVSLADAARIARDRLRRVTEPHGSVGRRGVAVLTPHEIRGLGFSAVLFTGLCSGGFPPGASHDPILPDAERRELARRLGLPLAEVGAREREADMLCALARTAATESFVALVPRRDAAGVGRQPSRVAIELAEELTGRVATAEDFSNAPLAGVPLRRVPSGAPPVAVANGALVFPEGRCPADLRDLDVALLAALHQDCRGGSAAGAPRRYLEQVCGVGGARRLLGRRLAGASSAVLAWDGVFHSRRARRAIAAAGLFSGPQAPTALQEYARCPFSYYILSVLGIEPVEEPEALVEADRREVGKVVHRVLQRIFAAVAEGAGKEDAVAMVPAVAAQECRQAERRGGVGLPLVWQSQSAQLVEDVALVVAGDGCWSEPAGPQPWQFELSFGDGATPVVLGLADGRSVRFHGRMDRIDRSADGRRLLVLDYKSGKGKAEKQQVQSGRNIQLPVYQLACRTLLAVDSDAQIDCAFRMVTRRRELAEVALTTDEAKVTQDLAVTVAVIMGLVEAGVFPRVAASENMCEWCGAAYGCDELKAASRSKRGHPALAELAKLRQPVEATSAASLAAEGEDDA
jgi:ATP-dependent helicase/nuclease subunit B